MAGAAPAHEQKPAARFGAVTVVPGDKNGKYPDGNQVIVQGRDARAVFDSPQVAQRIGALYDDADLSILGHVHEDHMAGLGRIPRAEVWVHEADVEAARSWAGLSAHYGYPAEVLAPMREKIEREFAYTPRPDARAYADGHQWDLGGGITVRAVHLPGHTRGHCALLVEPAGVAFIGDIDLSSFGPYYGDACSDLTDFRQSLRRVAELPARVWVTSHHKGVYTDRAAFEAALAAYAATLDAREQKLLAMVDSAGPGGATLGELVRLRLLYPPEHDALWVDCAESRTIGLHLDELAAAGRLRCDDGRWRRA